MKITFVGQSTYFEYCALSAPSASLTPKFIDFRVGADPGRLRQQLLEDPADVLIVFKPETIQPRLLAGIPGTRIGWFTEPLPRKTVAPARPYNDPRAEPDHKRDLALADNASQDLSRRLQSARTTDPENFDRFIVFDPLIAATVEEFVPVWQALPLPVDDTFFQPVPERPNFPPRAAFFGRPTLHRDLMLGPSLHAFDVRYIAHGVFGADLRDMIFAMDVAINLHNERYPNFENRVSLHLAGGNLVISEPLSPPHGLEPGIDFLEVKTPTELYIAIEEARLYPDAYHTMRLRGREKAEYFRASRVYAKLVGDL